MEFMLFKFMPLKSYKVQWAADEFIAFRYYVVIQFEMVINS